MELRDRRQGYDWNDLTETQKVNELANDLDCIEYHLNTIESNLEERVKNIPELVSVLDDTMTRAYLAFRPLEDFLKKQLLALLTEGEAPSPAMDSPSVAEAEPEVSPTPAEEPKDMESESQQVLDTEPEPEPEPEPEVYAEPTADDFRKVAAGLSRDAIMAVFKEFDCKSFKQILEEGYACECYAKILEIKNAG